jgi:hypothetical protein
VHDRQLESSIIVPVPADLAASDREFVAPIIPSGGERTADSLQLTMDNGQRGPRRLRAKAPIASEQRSKNEEYEYHCTTTLRESAGPS